MTTLVDTHERKVRAITSRAVYLARLKAGLTQQQLADLMGIYRSTLARIESGRHGITLQNAVRVADICGIQFTKLFKELDQIDL
jgi:transcriptional regulator with XRE-family HTH domain